MFLSNINSLSQILADKNLNQEDAELIQGEYITANYYKNSRITAQGKRGKRFRGFQKVGG